jgi:hypothetical protein
LGVTKVVSVNTVHVFVRRFKQLYAINEVESTILATFTVIAAILPMAFVSGMMGLMSPMPIGASIAMIIPVCGFDRYLFRISFITRKDDNQSIKMPKARNKPSL